MTQAKSLEARGQFDQHVYEQLLGMQTPKVKKGSQAISVFLSFWDA